MHQTQFSPVRILVLRKELLSTMEESSEHGRERRDREIKQKRSFFLVLLIYCIYLGERQTIECTFICLTYDCCWFVTITIIFFEL